MRESISIILREVEERHMHKHFAILLLEDICLLREHPSWMRHDFELILKLSPRLHPFAIGKILEGCPFEDFDKEPIIPFGALAKGGFFRKKTALKKLAPYIKTAVIIHWRGSGNPESLSYAMNEKYPPEDDFWDILDAAEILPGINSQDQLLESARRAFSWFDS